MKKYLFLPLVVCLIVFGSCKSDSKPSKSEDKNLQEEVNSDYKTISGELIYTDSVAVLKKRDEIYGVVMNTKAKDLIAQARELNSDPFTSFDVTLSVEIMENPEKDAWPEVIDIKNIIKVKPSSNDDSLRLNK